MGRTCKVCGGSRPNEKFGGKGLRRVVCKDCRKLPKDEITKILATEEVYHFLEQSNISKKNIERLESLTSIKDERFQRLRGFVLEIAKVKPGKKRRWKVLRERHPDLLERAVKSGFFDWLLDQYIIDSGDEDLMSYLDEFECGMFDDQICADAPDDLGQDIDPREIPY